MTRAGRRSALWAAALAGCLAFAAVAVLRVSSSAADRIQLSDVRWGWAVLSGVASLAFLLVYSCCWWMLVSALEHRRAPFGATVRLFLLAWPGRYMPASLGYYGGRLAAAPGIGLSRSAVAASLVYENVFAIAGAGLVSLVALVAGYRGLPGGGGWLLAAAIAVPLAAAALHPAVARAVIRVAGRRIKRLQVLEDHVLTARHTAGIGLAYAAGSVFTGLTYWAALRALSADPPLFLAIAAYNLGGIAGMLALFVPGGVGVREGVAATILGVAAAAPVAIGAAVLARLTSIIADLTPLLVILIVHLAVRVAHALRPGRPAPLAGPSKVRS